MKKVMISLAFLLCLTPGIKAQQSGKFWTGGTLGFTTSKVEDGIRLTNYSILPEFGYGFSDRWGAGISLGYLHNEYEIIGAKIKTDGFSVNPFARYSLLRGRIGNLFLDGGVGYAYRDNKTTDREKHAFEVGIRPGVSVNITDNIALMGRFGFLGYQYEKEGGTKTNTFAADFDLNQVQLGVNILF